MPELPEVEAARRALHAVMQGERFDRVVTRRPDLRVRFPSRFAFRLQGQAVRALRRRGKYLLAELSSDEVLVMHLGMSGSFRVKRNGNESAAGADLRHDHVIFRMSSGATVIFNDPRRFGFMDIVPSGELLRYRRLSALGPEPLGPEFDAAVLAAACKTKQASLKAALSDQRVVAGLGNIYICEALHRARLSPRRGASTIATRSGAPRDGAYRLAAAIRKVLNDAIARSAASGQDEPVRFRVYDRAGVRCPRSGCIGVVKRIVQAGRATFFCPVCQR